MSEDPSTIESIPPDSEDALKSSEPTKAAFTIVVQSWATPILSILMLAFGLFGGYFGRPLIESDQNPITSDENPSSGAVTVPTPDADLAAQQQELMEMVVSETRHFRGDPNAPVTIIEFSDFQ